MDKEAKNKLENFPIYPINKKINSSVIGKSLQFAENGAFKVLGLSGYTPIHSLFLVELSQFEVKCDTEYNSVIVL